MKVGFMWNCPAEYRRAQIQAQLNLFRSGETTFLVSATQVEWLLAELSRLSRERDEAVAKSHIDETGYNEMRDTAAQLAQEVDRLSRVEQALREALLGVQSTSRVYCWCDRSYDALTYGHQGKCATVRILLSASPEAQPEEGR